MTYLDFFGAAGGVGRVSRELIPALAQLGGEPVIVAGPSFAVDSLRAGIAASPTAIRFENLTPSRSSPARLGYELALRSDALFGHAFEYFQRELERRDLQSRGLALVNYPQALHPPRSSQRIAVFIHDLNWRSFPENFANPRRMDDWAREWVHKSVVVLTNSEFTRDEVIAAYGLTAGKVIAAPLAPYEDIGRGLGDASILTRLGVLADRYYLCAGVHGAHKGHDVLCAALESAGATLPIVVTCGSRVPVPNVRRANGARLLQEQMQALEKSGRLIVLPQLPVAEIRTLRAHCRGHVLPSRYEGYGFPLAEALAGGKPAIFSAIPAYLEIARRHGGLRYRAFVSGDSEALARLLEADYSGGLNWNQSEGASGEAWTWKNTAEIIRAACQSK